MLWSEDAERLVVNIATPLSDEPAVICPRCQLPMMRGAAPPIMFTNGLSEVRYSCETCNTQSVRTFAADGTPHSSTAA